jgi:hypothetical protein
MPDQARQETVRIVLALDTAIAAFRAGRSTSLRALDAASLLIREAKDVSANSEFYRVLPPRPDRVELAIQFDGYCQKGCRLPLRGSQVFIGFPVPRVSGKTMRPGFPTGHGPGTPAGPADNYPRL